MWNDRVEPHLKSEMYDLPSFMKGKSSLNEIELDLLGDIKGKRILHLQCHFGMDSLSLARMGARVTGLDFSETAIDQARKLNTELGLDAEFICSDVLKADVYLKDNYDIVFTSYGTITWLPELGKWAEIVAKSLKKGGLFIMAEFHPVVWMFDDDFNEVFYGYFNSGPIIEDVEGTYADRDANLQHTFVGWNHATDEVLTSLLDTGLQLRKFREYDHSPYAIFKDTVKTKSGYMVKGLENKLPLVYSMVMEKID